MYKRQYASTPPQQVALPVVRRMWAQFQRGLPDGVSVRAWQKRTDVLRAMIVGPEGTPYEGALFAFDLALPATYPAQPPTVHYLTQGIGERLNPNLYENGKVCLSLLGTWQGAAGETWDPKCSTLLQVGSDERMSIRN